MKHDVSTCQIYLMNNGVAEHFPDVLPSVIRGRAGCPASLRHVGAQNYVDNSRCMRYPSWAHRSVPLLRSERSHRFQRRRCQRGL